MNERIKELMVELKKTVSTHRGDAVLIGYDEIEKFAELIVQECAKVLDDKLANPNGANMAYCDGSDLLEHFGVEE